MTSFTFKLLILLSLAMPSCASEEDRVKRKKYFGGESIDVSTLSYGDLNTNQSVNLKTYMESNSLNHVFLVFGSVGCAKCNEKAKILSHNLMGQHELLLGEKTKGFELIGVNTDIGTAQERFSEIWSDESSKYDAGYSFVKWSDPGASSVKEQLLKAGSNFAIPFMVLLSKDSLLTRYDANDERSIEDVLDDVLRVVQGGQPIEQPKPPTQEPVPPVQKPPLVVPSVTFQKPILSIQERFANEKVYSCGDGKVMSLAEVISGRDSVFHLPTNECDESCNANLLSLLNTNNDCDNQQTCKVIDYRIGDFDPNLCETDFTVLGKSNFREVFESAVSWRSDLVKYSTWGEPESLASEDRSIILTFNSKSQLMDLKAGTVSQSKVDEMLQLSRPNRDYIPEFSLIGSLKMSEKPDDSNLRKVLSSSKYTVFYEYGPGCASCDKKLQKWSYDDGEIKGLSAYCQSKPTFCQVIALNKPMFGFQTPLTAYEQTRSHMIAQNISLPLYVDADEITKDPQADAFPRFFDGFLKPMFIQDWADEFGLVLNGASVIYDQEGKIIYQIAPSSDPNAKDEVAESIYSLWLYEQGRVK